MLVQMTQLLELLVAKVTNMRALTPVNISFMPQQAVPEGESTVTVRMRALERAVSVVNSGDVLVQLRRARSGTRAEA
jgi:hypothetical protein